MTEAQIDSEIQIDVDDLRANLTGSLALPNEPGYELARAFNVSVPVRPAAVVAVDGARDVAETVRFAAANGLRVVVQRTGHGALPVAGDAIVVHTGRLTELVVDPSARTARVGAGVVWQQVIEAATPHGLAPIGGSAPGVGVVGYLTGGGIGPLVRTAGLSSDLIRALDVVTGDGRVLRATPEQNADLFWGLRGGKAALGIVTAVEIDLLPIAEIYGGAVYFDGSDAAAVLAAWRVWSVGLPETANTSVALLQLPPLPTVPPPLAGKLTVAVRFTSTGGEAESAELLAPIRAVATPLIDTVATMPYTAIGSVHADPAEPMPYSEASTLLRELPAEAIDALLELAGPGSRSPQAVVELRLLGGAIGRPSTHPSAYDHRAAAYNLSVIGALAPQVAEAVPPHGRAVLAAMQPWSTGGRLANFAPSADPAEAARVYTPETRARLTALAEQHDPAHVLRSA